MASRVSRFSRFLFLTLLVCAPLLSGYVLPPTKVLERWFRDGSRPAVEGPVMLAVRFQGRDGQLYLGSVGRISLVLDHALSAEGSTYAPAGTVGESRSLWGALELLLAEDPEGAMGGLQAAGVDTDRAGYARDGCSADGVAHTLGAQGEGESERPQVWFARNPLRLCRVRLGDDVQVGPPGPHGWPVWFRLDQLGVLELVGEPVPAQDLPPLTRPQTPPWRSPGPEPIENWRRAFDTVKP